MPTGARPDPRETRGCGRHAERSRPGHCPPPRREFSAAAPRTPIPNLTAGACESAKASPERTGTGRGPALGAESGALPAGQPRPRPPRGATLHLQGGGGRDPLHEAHPYTGPLGGGRAPRPGNAAEAGEPRRSWVPCPPVRGDGAGPLASAPPASAISDSARWRSEATQKRRGRCGARDT